MLCEISPLLCGREKPKLLWYIWGEICVEMTYTLSAYFLRIEYFLPAQYSADIVQCRYKACQLFQSFLFFEIEECNLLTRNVCIAVVIARDIVVERDQTTAGNKGLKLSHRHRMEFTESFFQHWIEGELKTLLMSALYKLAFVSAEISLLSSFKNIDSKTLREEILLSTTWPQFAIDRPYL